MLLAVGHLVLDPPPRPGWAPAVPPLAGRTSLCRPESPAEHPHSLLCPFPLRLPSKVLAQVWPLFSPSKDPPAMCPNPSISAPESGAVPRGSVGLGPAWTELRSESRRAALCLAPDSWACCAVRKTKKRKTQGTGSPQRLEQLPNLRGRQPGVLPSALSLHHLELRHQQRCPRHAPFLCTSRACVFTHVHMSVHTCAYLCTHNCMTVHACTHGLVVCTHAHTCAQWCSTCGCVQREPVQWRRGAPNST